MSGKILLIDGHSILNRAYFAMPKLTDLTGRPTGAVYGFLNTILKILSEEEPDYFTVAFDVHAPTFRHEMYPEYKGTRSKMPDDLRPQVDLIQQVLTTMGVKIMKKKGFEADDVIGSLAKYCENQGLQVVIISGDRDLLQLATDKIKVRIPKTVKGQSIIEDYFAADVKERYQVSPAGIIELKGLMGDSSDNIPGVKGVGEKTATKLLVEYGTVEGVYEHIDEIKGSVQTKLINDRDQAFLSRKLATIDTDVQLDFNTEEAKMPDFKHNHEAYNLFAELNFKNLLSNFEISEDQQQEKAEEELELKTEDFNASNFPLDKVKGQVISLYMEDYGKSGEFYLGLKDKKVFTVKDDNEKLTKLIPLIAEASEKTVVYDSKVFYTFFNIKYTDIKKENRLFDLQIAAYLINPLNSSYLLADILAAYTGFSPKNSEKEDRQLSLLEEEESDNTYFVYAAHYMLKSFYKLEEVLEDEGMKDLYYDIDLPLSLVLSDMERKGIYVERPFLKDYSERLNNEIVKLEQEIYSESGREFNISSPKQLGDVLFNDLKLPHAKKTKTGYSTAADVLEKLAPDHKIVADVLKYRHFTKLKSTYADSLEDFIGEDGRIHSSFNQTVTATGRISSDKPNLQNIPVRTEIGRELRKAFVPAYGSVFIDADYSQIELRVLAHMSGDENLINAYKEGKDIHRATAASVFGIPFEDVTDEERSRAKAVNFGIIYGISAFGLSRDINIPVKEADLYIKNYFATFPKIEGFLHGLVDKAKETGYSETMFGRKRAVPELNEKNFMRKSFGERIAMNTPIQGTAADIIKLAMIRVYERINREGLKTGLILQVHDELLLEVPFDEVPAAKKILKEEMENAVKLAVPLTVDVNQGDSWYEAK